MKRRIDLEEKMLGFLYHWLRPIRIGDLRNELKKDGTNIPHSSINSIIQRLVEDELVEWEKYGPIRLTDKGRQLAAPNLRHYHLVVMFLMEVLGLSHEEAKEESQRISSVISCSLIDKINKALKNPEKCHCNETIPKIIECSTKRTLEELS